MSTIDRRVSPDGVVRYRVRVRPIADVTRARIVAFRQMLVDTPGTRKRARGYATTNRYLAVLSHPFTFAVDEWGWAPENPVGKVKRVKESRAYAISFRR